MKLNDTVKHIFKEAILDCEQGASMGYASAIACLNKFQMFLKLNAIPIGEVCFVYNHYQNQRKYLIHITDPRLEGLKSEVSYVINYLNSYYTFKEVDGVLITHIKSELEIGPH